MLRLGDKLLAICSAENKAASSRCHSDGAGTLPAEVKALPHVLV